MKCAEYLDAIKEQNQITSDNALAEYLGIHRQMVSNYRRDRHAFDNKTAVIVAKELGLDPMQVIQDMELQRAKDDKTREFWLSIKPILQHGVHASVVGATAIAIVIAKAVNELALLTSCKEIIKDLNGLMQPTRG